MFVPFIGSNRGILFGGGLPLALLGLLVVIVTPILPDSLLRTSAFLFVPAGSRLGNGGMSTLLSELSESMLNVDVERSGGVVDSRSSNELATVSSSGVTGFNLRATVLPVVDSS